jgi:hypothetical protein
LHLHPFCDWATAVRKAGRKLLIVSLMALYGGVSLLGYGLHELSPAHQHAHANGAPHAHLHSHAGCSHHHHHAHPPVPDRPGWSDAHDCDICHLLDQLRSELPPIVVIDAWQKLETEILAVSAIPTAAGVAGLHVPRGPPALVS